MLTCGHDSQGLLGSIFDVAQCVGGILTLLPGIGLSLLTNLPGIVTSLLNIPESILNPVTCVSSLSLPSPSSRRLR